MKSFQAAVVIAAAAALALPASAAPPSGEIARLKHEITRLRAKVSRLTAANKRLRLDNKTLTARWNESLGRENVLSERVAESDPCPITHPNGSTPPGPTFGAAFEGNGAIWVGLEMECNRLATRSGWVHRHQVRLVARSARKTSHRRA
jgi:hypothetical protein